MGWKRRSSMQRLSRAAVRGVKAFAKAPQAVVGAALGLGVGMREAIATVVDQMVYIVNPQASLERRVLRQISRAADARMSSGDRDRDDAGDRLHGPQRWLGSRLSPDSELEQDLESLRAHTKELYRDTTAGGAIDARVDHVVGKGFTVQAKITAGKGLSQEAADGFNDELEEVYRRWSPACDITGRDSLWQLSRLVERSIAYAGEAFTVMWARNRPGRAIPLVLEVVDVDRISTPPDRTGDPNCRLGIQYSADGEIEGYWLRTTHPDDTRKVEYKWQFIPADRMLHVYEKWFPGQSRGYPWMVRSLNRWRDGEDLDEAGIIAAQVEACNAAFVKTRQPLKAAQAMGTNSTSGKRLEDMSPGKITYLDSDAEEVLFNTPSKSNIVGTLHEWNHRRIAAGMNWPYEFLMKDWRGVSFAGGRLVLNGAKITCQCEQQLLVVAWFAGIWNEMVREAVLFSVTSGVTINLSRFQQRPWVYQAHQWSAPAWTYAITPGEEIDADIKAVEHNFKTLEQVAGERGGNMEDVLEQRQKERKLEEAKGIEPPDRIAAKAQQGQQSAKQSQDTSPQGKEMASV